MNRRGIAFKLFFITSVIFIIFITGILIFQSVFFEKFYINRKTSELKDNVTSFIAQEKKDNGNLNNLYFDMMKFEAENNCEIGILVNHGESSILSQRSSQNGSDDRMQALVTAMKQWQLMYNQTPDSLYLRTDITYNVENTAINTNEIAMISPTFENSKIKDVIFVVATLQPVNEAVAIINEYYFYIYIGALILILALSFIYSNMISKPLINLNKTAISMSNLDFSKRSKIKSHDELGNLASALNFLSEKLGSTLWELQAANEKLRGDLEKEKELENMRKEFVAGVSHELKTPISLIEGYTEGLKDGVVEGEEKDFYLDVIVDETKKMNSLVSDMLNLSELESGKTQFTKGETEINYLVSRVSKKYMNNMNEKRLNFEIKLLQEETIVYCDSFKIEQVLTNIIRNGIRHTPKDKKIYITLKDNGENILIEIENEGSSIPEEDLTKIWEKFYKVDKSRNRNLGGTGLGLAITKNILNLHQSIFGVRNTEKGVCFFFTLDKYSERSLT